MPLSISRNSLS